jgi:hypothetical protein
MTTSLKIDRRAFLKGIGGVALALPVLDAMGAEVTGEIPRRFCAPLHRKRHVAPEIGTWPCRLELVSHSRPQRRSSSLQGRRSAQPLPETN